jgi:folate-binding protein YgfZ
MPIVAYSDACLTVWNGNDVLKFLDGLSTNKLTSLQPGEVVQTVFTTMKAQIIDVVTVFNMGSFVALQSHESKLSQLLQHITPRILNQDVQITNVTERNDFYIEFEIENTDIGKINTHDGVTSGRIGEEFSILIASKGTECETTATQEEFEKWRIQTILPWHGHEINEKNHPLACGLQHLVHPAKGCYIGQEVLTRMISRGKQGKILQKVQTKDVDERFITTHGVEVSLAITRPKKIQ